jgi:hypothetical protein
MHTEQAADNIMLRDASSSSVLHHKHANKMLLATLLLLPQTWLC